MLRSALLVGGGLGSALLLRRRVPRSRVLFVRTAEPTGVSEAEVRAVFGAFGGVVTAVRLGNAKSNIIWVEYADAADAAAAAAALGGGGKHGTHGKSNSKGSGGGGGGGPGGGRCQLAGVSADVELAKSAAPRDRPKSRSKARHARISSSQKRMANPFSRQVLTHSLVLSPSSTCSRLTPYSFLPSHPSTCLACAWRTNPVSAAAGGRAGGAGAEQRLRGRGAPVVH